MIRILFVDDEKHVLDGFRRLLRVKRTEWDPSFATGGPEALEAMSREPFDVVVSDMKMPGMDGADLLARVKERHPGTIRIILSGHSGRDLVAKALGSAQQYLPKPCDPGVLQSTIDRAASLRSLLTSAGLQKLVGQLASIPSVPELYQEINRVLQDPDASTRDVAKVIAQDMGMTVKLLALVNSAFFGLPQRITTVEQAVTFLGIETVSSLVLGSAIFETGQDVEIDGFSLDRTWRRTMQCALSTRALARHDRADRQVADDSFAAATLQDVGRVVIAVNAPERYREALRLVEDGARLSEAECSVFGAGHDSVGAYLLGVWGMPDPILEAVAGHETAMEPGHALDARAYTHLGAMLTAECLDRDPSVTDYLESLGLDSQLADWRQACRKALSEEVEA